MEVLFTITSNKKIANLVYEMELTGDTSLIKKPGQFVEIKVEPYYLRRPISVCDFSENYLKLIYKVVGKGTQAMSEMIAGEKLSILTGLGNGYELKKLDDKLMLVGGGVGVPPMYGLAKKLRQAGKDVTVILGYNRADDVFYQKQFEDLGCKTVVYTMDGSYGEKGVVTNGIESLGYQDVQYCACGPLPMLKALAKMCSRGYMSLEARMGCGFGACMGCSIQTKKGSRRVCKEGPVFESEELLWED